MTTVSAVADHQKKGAAPQRYPKDIIIMKHTDIAGQAQLALPFISEGIVTLNPAQAGMILRECAYDHQRPIARLHVLTLAELMKRGTWQPKDKIDFARLPDGQIVLVNGYHRMTAQLQSGKDVVWLFAIHDCADQASVRSLYYKFDTNIRARSSENILQGIGFAEENGLTRMMAKNVYHAVSIIKSGLSVGAHKMSDEMHVASRIADDRIAMAREYAPFAEKLWGYFEEAPPPVKRKLNAPAFCATALVTVKYQEKMAEVFWRGFAENDGLARNDPRAVLLRECMTRNTQKGLSGTNAMLVAKAWSAFFDGKQVQFLRINAGQVCPVRGTPYVVKL